jgi:hypothetical protein
MSFSWENLGENNEKVDVYTHLSTEAMKQEKAVEDKFVMINQLLRSDTKDKNISMISNQISEEAILITTLITELSTIIDKLSSHIINSCSNAPVKRLSLQRHQEVLYVILFLFLCYFKFKF